MKHNFEKNIINQSGLSDSAELASICLDMQSYTIKDKKIIRADGSLNSPFIKTFVQTDLFHRLVKVTSFLPCEAPLSQRWWHVVNNASSFNKCVCGSLIHKWRRKYPRFCSKLCALTSDEARERAQKSSTGRAITLEQRIKRSIARTGKKHSDDTKKNLSLMKLGPLNPCYGKIPWNKGLIGPLNPMFGVKRPERLILRGARNPSYGKSPNYRCGRGIWGKFNGKHFRSSLEMFYLMYWYEHEIYVESAEQDQFRINYITGGVTHTYTPDFYISSKETVIELKPEKLQEHDDVLKKQYTFKAIYPCLNYVVLGFQDISDYIKNSVCEESVNTYLGNLLIIEESQLIRLRKNYGDILRATKGAENELHTVVLSEWQISKARALASR
jgi:hypothetical protein